MRRLLCLLLLCALAPGGWPEDKKSFLEAYRNAPNAKARAAAITALAKADVPEAAEQLIGLFGDLSKETGKLGAELAAGREELRKLEEKKRKARDDRARKKLLDQILKLKTKDVARDKRLAGIETERRAVLQGLRSMRSKATLDWMAGEGLRRCGSPVLLRAVAARAATTREGAAALTEALGKLRKPEQVVPLLHALSHPNAQPVPSVEPILPLLAHRDWAVRAAAAGVLARAAKPEGVGPLVEALARERPRSRGQLELTRALQRLTGKRFDRDPALWQRWWREHKGDVLAGRVPLGRGEAPVAVKSDQGHFYGIPQDVDRIIYVFDQSGSMQVSMENPRWEGKAAVPAYDDEDSRFDAAVRELLRAVKKLRRGSSFAVILYSDRARKLHDKLVPATPDEHAKLANAMAREGPHGSTNIYEALDLALRMANVHSHQTRGEQRADAIFLVSDGAPTDSEGNVEDPERTLQAVREWNAMKRIAIHTIGIGRQHNSGFLSKLASENGGKYYAVLPKRKPKKKKKN